MQKYSKEQRALLKGLSEVSADIFALEQADRWTPAEKQRHVLLERVRRALLLDCEQEAAKLTGITWLSFRSQVTTASMATERPLVPPADYNGDLRDYPSNLEADSKPAPSGGE